MFRIHQSTKGARMPLAVTNVEFSIFLHVTAVVVGFGSTFSESVMFPVAMKMSARNLPYVHRLQLAINQWLATPALAIVLATGIYQVTDQDAWGFDQFWVSAAFTIVIVIGALLGAYFIPTDRRLGPMVEREIAAAGDRELSMADLSEEYQRRGRMEGIVGTVTGILLVIAVYLMVTKPGV
jgi:MFS family permease